MGTINNSIFISFANSNLQTTYFLTWHHYVRHIYNLFELSLAENNNYVYVLSNRMIGCNFQRQIFHAHLGRKQIQ